MRSRRKRGGLGIQFHFGNRRWFGGAESNWARPRVHWLVTAPEIGTAAKVFGRCLPPSRKECEKDGAPCTRGMFFIKDGPLAAHSRKTPAQASLYGARFRVK